MQKAARNLPARDRAARAGAPGGVQSRFGAPLDVNDKRRPTLWQVLGSVLAAMFGVQSERNRVRDFTHGNLATFFIVGLLLTAVFVAGLYLLVIAIVHEAGV